MQARFIIKGKPKGKGRPRAAKRGVNIVMYTPRDTVEYENIVKQAYRAQCKSTFFVGSIALHIKAHMGIPSTFNKTARAEALSGKIQPMCKPDVDNIAKIILDALNGVAYADDASVAAITVQKLYADAPHVEVFIEDLQQER